MANDNKQKKSLLHRLSWNNNGKQLNNNVADLLGLGQKCIDIWINGDNSDTEGTKIIQYFENIDRTLIDMQLCIMNVLKPSSLAHKILEDRIEYKTKLSDCQCKLKMLKLQERLAIEREKFQILVKETTILTQEKRNLNARNEELEKTLRNKDGNFKQQNNILIENLKQQSCNDDKELEELRVQFRTELINLKDELRTCNRENYNLRQRLLQIPVLEQNFDQQRQKFILEIRTCQEKIKNFEKNLYHHKEDLCKLTEINQDLKQKLLQISSLKANDFKLKEIEYQKNINTLEESIFYFIKRNNELKRKLNANCPKDNDKEINRKKIKQITELENDVNNMNVNVKQNKNDDSENISTNIFIKQANTFFEKIDTNEVNEDLIIESKEEIQKSEYTPIEENLIIDHPNKTCLFPFLEDKIDTHDVNKDLIIVSKEEIQKSDYIPIEENLITDHHSNTCLFPFLEDKIDTHDINNDLIIIKEEIQKNEYIPIEENLIIDHHNKISLFSSQNRKIIGDKEEAD